MKNLIVVMAATILFGMGCDKVSDEVQPPIATKGNVVFVFKNTVDGNLIQTGNISYVNEAGNQYSVDVLKYYISNITFIKADGSEFKAPNYELIDESKSASKYFTVENLPYGNYTGLRFYMGVDSTINNAGALTGDLDPVNGMFWDWQSGYVNFKHEGNFIDSVGNTTTLTYHFGTLKALVTEELPLNFDFNAPNKIITVTFNLNKLYKEPNLIDFNGNNIHQSTGPNDNGWIQILRENFDGAYEITSIQ